MTPLVIGLYIVTGIIAGLLGGLLGIGGGFVVVPAMLLSFKWMNFTDSHLMQLAIGTTLCAMVFTSLSSAISHYLKKGVNWYFFISLFPGIILGSIIGALIAHAVSSESLRKFYAIAEILVGVFFLYPFHFDNIHMDSQPNGRTALLFFGILIGCISTILGIGGGIMTVPLLVFFGVSVKNSISTSAVTGVIIAITGALSFFLLGIGHTTSLPGVISYTFIPAFLIVGISSVLSAPFGAKLAYWLPDNYLRAIWGVVLIGLGLYTYFY